MPCNNCAFIRVVFFRELYFKEMCGSAETTQKSKRSRREHAIYVEMGTGETTQKSKRSRSVIVIFCLPTYAETTQKSKRSRRQNTTRELEQL